MENKKEENEEKRTTTKRGAGNGKGKNTHKGFLPMALSLLMDARLSFGLLFLHPPPGR